MSTATSPVKVNGGGPAPETSSLASASAPAASASASAPAGVGSAASSIASASTKPAPLTAAERRALNFNPSAYVNRFGGNLFTFHANGDVDDIRSAVIPEAFRDHSATQVREGWQAFLAAKARKDAIDAWVEPTATPVVSKPDATKTDATKDAAKADADKTAKKDEKKDESGWCSYLWNGVTGLCGSIGKAIWYVISFGPCVDFFSWLCGSSEKKDATAKATVNKDGSTTATATGADGSKTSASTPAPKPATAAK